MPAANIGFGNSRADVHTINFGMRIFDLLGERQKLSLISATPYESGVTVLRYKLNNE